MTIEAVGNSGAVSGAAASGASAAAQQTDPAFSKALKNAVSADSEHTPYDDIFERASQKYGVPVRLLKAVAKAESRYDADAVSDCGALGVMQLMPSTAQALGVADPLDPEQNIMGGAKYLGDSLKQYGGSAELALAAYNAGSGNVEKYGGVPPFGETRSYIASVMADAGMESGTPVSSASVCSDSDAAASGERKQLSGTLNSSACDRLTAECYLSLLQSVAARMADNAARRQTDSESTRPIAEI